MVIVVRAVAVAAEVAIAVAVVALVVGLATKAYFPIKKHFITITSVWGGLRIQS